MRRHLFGIESFLFASPDRVDSLHSFASGVDMQGMYAFLAAVIVGSLTSAICLAQPAIGDKPTLAFDAHSGEHVDLKAFRGRMVVVDFWASWCPATFRATEMLVELEKQYRSKGLALIGINMDRRVEDMKDYSTRLFWMSWPQYHDGREWDNRFAKEWGVTSIPHVLLIGPEGDLLWRGHPEELTTVLEEAFAKHPVTWLPPDVRQAADAKLQAAEKMLERGDLGALRVLSSIDKSALANKEVAAQVESLRTRAAEEGEARLIEAEDLIKQEKYREAAILLSRLQLQYQGTPLGQKCQERQRTLRQDPKAQAAFAAAHKEAVAASAARKADQLKADGKHEQAYKQYQEVAKEFRGTGAGEAAEAAIAAYDADEGFLKQRRDAAIEAKAKSALSLAQSYARNGRHDSARQRYQQIIAEYPGTTWADQARQELHKLPQ